MARDETAGRAPVHLAVHSAYSFHGGTALPERLARAAKERGFGTLALTDLNGLYGAVGFYQACREHGLKPLIGATLDDPQRHRRRAVALSGPGSCPLNPDQGEMILEFALRGERGVELARARSLRVRRGRVPPRLRLEVGGGCAVSRMRFEPGRTYRVLLRWMRWPTVREIWLWEGGRWRIVGSDDLTPWRGAGWRRDRVEFARSGVRWRRIEVFDRADPVAWTLNASFPEER